MLPSGPNGNGAGHRGSSFDTSSESSPWNYGHTIGRSTNQAGSEYLPDFGIGGQGQFSTASKRKDRPDGDDLLRELERQEKVAKQDTDMDIKLKASILRHRAHAKLSTKPPPMAATTAVSSQRQPGPPSPFPAASQIPIRRSTAPGLVGHSRTPSSLAPSPRSWSMLQGEARSRTEPTPSRWAGSE